MKILLIEDNVDQRELILRAFRKKNPELLIHSARDGPSSLNLLAESQYDAIILDYNLPLMNGLEVLRRIHAGSCTSPVIMVTGQGDESVAVEAMKIGAYDYIIKSGNYHESLPLVLNKVIEQYLLRRKLENASARLRQLYEISLSVTTERKLEVLADTLVKGAVNMMESEGAILFLTDHEKSEITLLAVSGLTFSSGVSPISVDSVGLLGFGFFNRKPSVVENPQEHGFWIKTPVLNPPLRQILSVPLVLQGKFNGGFSVINKKNKEPFTQEDIDAFLTLAVNAQTSIDNVRFIMDKEKQAVTDSLTGLFNHMEFQKRLLNEAERGLRYKKEFSLLMIDPDHFKAINDSYGHPAGDAILKEVVEVILKCIRNVDIPARYGGEELAVILPETSEEQAEKVAERILKTVSETPYKTSNGQWVHLSVSIGIASFPLDAGRAEDLISRADEALLFCKKTGRNRVCRVSQIHHRN